MSAYRDVAIACPHCHVALTAVERPHATQHTCPRCGGIWIDDDELQRMFIELAIPPRAPLGPLELQAGPVPCPRCGEPMAVERTAGGEPPLIDVCAAHGAWFDRDELEIALTRLQHEQLDRARGPYHNAGPDAVVFIWLWQLFRRARDEPPRTRGLPF